MGCWGHDLLPMRQARRLIPPQISHVRLLARRCGLPVSITDEERDILETRRPKKLVLAWAALRYSTKGALFHLTLGIEMTYRYVRYIWMSKRPIVITDRYIYDLEFRQGRNPFPHGKGTRRILYRLFPPPDGILYLSAPYDVVAQRKPQLSREQFETMDRVFQQVLRRHHALQITPDAPPIELAGAFLSRHWQDVLLRCNRRA
jgi:thymidylate kinase